MGDANANVKAAVLEKRPPAVVERRAPGASAPAPRAPSLAGLLGGGKGNEAAAAVEGHVPRRERRRQGEVSQKKSGRHETAAVTPNPKPETFPEPREPERDGSSLGARALDLRLEKAARADDSTLAPRQEPETRRTRRRRLPARTFFFDVFAEGLERAERGSNIMGTFSEGQLSRVVPEAALPPGWGSRRPAAAGTTTARRRERRRERRRGRRRHGRRRGGGGGDARGRGFRLRRPGTARRPPRRRRRAGAGAGAGGAEGDAHEGGRERRRPGRRRRRRRFAHRIVGRLRTTTTPSRRARFLSSAPPG